MCYNGIIYLKKKGINTLTLKWSRYWALPLVVKGVPMDPNSENAFPEGIFD